MPLAPDLKNKLFLQIKSLLQKQCPPMVVSKDTPDTFEIIGNKPVPYGSKKEIVPGMYFSSAVARKDMICLYFFPIYYEQSDFIKLIPSVSKCLKGKTCFHFKKEEDVNEQEISALLLKGVDTWRQQGYLQ